MARRRHRSGTRGIARRDFLKATAAGAAGVAVGMSTVAPALARSSSGLAPASRPLGASVGGGLVVAGPELALPVGFTYKTFGAFGSPMQDGFPTPPIHDGMGVFADGSGLRIVRNHELGDGNGIERGSVVGRPGTAYDRKAPGCTTTLVLDDNADLVESFVSANGMDSNCAGGATPWGTYLTCEESTIGTSSDRDKSHGYVFEVDPTNDGSEPIKPLRAMGRFVHEAAAVDPDNGVVYLTEDNNPDCFYRFVADTYGDLRRGTLQALRVMGQPGYNTVTGQTVGEVLPADWVTIPNPDRPEAESDPRTVLHIARRRGAARFMSGEGCTMVGNAAVFDSSDGGDAELGQIWRYTPTTNIGDLDEEGELELLYESTDRKVLDGPDNLCTSPNGRIVMAEDGKENQSFVRGLRNNGTIVNIAQNLVPIRLSIIDSSGKLYDPSVPDDDFSVADGLGYSEFAGPRFSPDGTWLFVNIQVPGITCAITGDWASLGL
ncbi:MAG: alkaline phosphatase PhoX [Actinomycetota bacterium]